MTEYVSEFIKCKNELLEESQAMLDLFPPEPEDLKNIPFDYSTFDKRVLTLKSKLSTLTSLSTKKPRNMKKLQKQLENLLEYSSELHLHNSDLLDYIYKCGYLYGQTKTVLSIINGIEFDITKRRFSINLDSLSIG